MAMRKHPSRFRAIRPATENLEERQMLSGVVSGINTEGDAWQLKLSGPGVITVTKQPDSSGNPTSLTAATEIATITIAGTDPLHSRLVGTVDPSGTGTGEVFFQNIKEIHTENNKGGGGNGLLSIDMPDFYLGLTAATAPTSSSGTLPGIAIPDGVSTLDFGGADTTAFFGASQANSLNNNGQNNQFDITLGIPEYNGTRIIVNKVITNTGSTASGATTPFYNGVTFAVQGRLGLFQANEIDGDSSNAPARFATAGGTVVESATPGAATGIPGPIGYFRVGTNATNLSVLTDDKIRDFFIGGETSNVSVLAPNGTRDLFFGKGMDTVEILTHTIEKLEANRGAINSTVISDRQIGNAEFGGDLSGTTIQAGYEQNLASDLANPTSLSTPTVQTGGQIRINVAGDITNSVIAASVLADPYNNEFGTPNTANLPAGLIKARVEGTINNSTATPDSPTAAFFAQKVILTKGPVVPPAVPEAPFNGPLTPTSLPGVPHPYMSHAIPRGPSTKK